MKTASFFFFLSLLIYSCTLPVDSTTEDVSGDFPQNAQVGNCYAKCVASDTANWMETTFYRYTGSDDLSPETFDLRFAENTNGQSLRIIGPKGFNDPLFATEGKQERIFTFLLYPNKEPITLRYQERLHPEVWEQILCPTDLTESKQKAIAEELIARGFDQWIDENFKSSDVNKTLVHFQRVLGLAPGNYSKSTMAFLGFPLK